MLYIDNQFIVCELIPNTETGKIDFCPLKNKNMAPKTFSNESDAEDYIKTKLNENRNLYPLTVVKIYTTYKNEN